MERMVLLKMHHCLSVLHNCHCHRIVVALSSTFKRST